MSVLAHRCRACGHVVGHHGERERGYTGCGCCRAGRADPDPSPELFPTWAFPGGAPEELWAPGTTRNAGTMHAVAGCGCAGCHAAADAIGRRGDADDTDGDGNRWSRSAAG